MAASVMQSDGWVPVSNVMLLCESHCIYALGPHFLLHCTATAFGQIAIDGFCMSKPSQRAHLAQEVIMFSFNIAVITIPFMRRASCVWCSRR